MTPIATNLWAANSLQADLSGTEMTSYLDVKGVQNDNSEVTIPFDGSEQILQFMRDCSTTELLLI
jgi:hypothetical protein